MQEDQRAKLKSIIRPLAMLLITSMLLVYGTFAWVRRQWTPSLEQSGIKISTGDSLSFMFDENTYGFSTSLNSMLGMEEFVLKSVSNSSGKSEDFFTLQHSHLGVGHEKYDLITKSDLVNSDVEQGQDYTELGKQYGYAELVFKIYASGSSGEQYVYLNPASYIANAQSFIDSNEDASINPAMSLRISLTWTEGEESETPTTQTVIFASDERVDADPRHKGVTNQLFPGTTNYVADGQKRCQYDGDDLVLDFYGNPIEATVLTMPDSSTFPAFAYSDLNKLSAYNGATAENCLFTLAGGEFKEVTVRIWLEGTDDHCVNEIAGKELDLLLTFSAKSSFADAQ